MLITDVTFEAFLKCETKSHLYFQRAVGVQSEFSEWQRNLRQKFKETGWERLRSTVREDQWCVGTPALQSLRSAVDPLWRMSWQDFLRLFGKHRRGKRSREADLN